MRLRGLFFEHDAEIGRKGHFWMGTIYTIAGHAGKVTKKSAANHPEVLVNLYVDSVLAEAGEVLDRHYEFEGPRV